MNYELRINSIACQSEVIEVIYKCPHVRYNYDQNFFVVNKSSLDQCTTFLTVNEITHIVIALVDSEQFLVENFSRKVNTKDYVKGTWQTRNSGLLYIL